MKFCTYFYGNYKRALITLTDQQNCLNRRVWNNMILSSEKANRALENNQSNKVDYFDYLKELQQNDLLSCEEKLFCKSILTGFTSCRQIIDNMNINIDLLDLKMSDLSGGQKSKIAFAHLLYSNSTILPFIIIPL